MTRGRTATGEGGVAAQTPAVVGKNGGEKGIETVAVAAIVTGTGTSKDGLTGAGAGAEVATEPRGPDTKIDGGKPRSRGQNHEPGWYFVHHQPYSRYVLLFEKAQ